MRALVVIFVVLSVARSSRADPKIGVVVAGEPTKQRAVKAQLVSWLEQHGYTTVGAPLDTEAQKTLLNCFVIEDMACARGTFEKRSKVDSIVFARVELNGDRELALTGYWLVKAHDAVAEKRWCRRCDDAELQRTVDQLMMFLARGSGVGDGHLEIHSKPEGMAVVLDDQPLGNTPVERSVGVGSHAIKLVRGGRTVATKTVVIEPGATASVSLRAEEERAQPAPQPPPSRRSRIVPAVLLASGAAALATGGVYFYYGHKSGPDEPRIYPYATRDGVVWTAIGAASIIAGGVLWLRAGSAPTVAIGPTGPTIGWAGQF